VTGTVVGVTGGTVVGVAGAAHDAGSATVPELEVLTPSEKVEFTVMTTVPVAVFGKVWSNVAVAYGSVPLPPFPFPEAPMAKEVGLIVDRPPVTEATCPDSARL
jgi:hypothetical protein